MRFREEQFDSSGTRPKLATSSRFLTDVLLVTSHSSTAGLLHLTSRRSYFIHQEPRSTTAPVFPGYLGPGVDCPVLYLLSPRVCKSCVNNLPLT
nr:unnamed protein product [Callosobruchus chinensis]